MPRVIASTCFRLGVDVVERTEELLFGDIVTVGAVASDTHAQGAGSAALALRLPHGVQKALADAFKSAIRPTEALERLGQGILHILVLAASALEDQLDLNLVLFPLLEVDHRSVCPDVIAAVFAAERVDRVRAQFTKLRCLRDGREDRVPDFDLIHTDRCMDIEGWHTGVLTNGAGVVGRHVDVGKDDVERLGCLRVRLLGKACGAHGGAHVRREVRGCLGDQFDEAVLEELHGKALL